MLSPRRGNSVYCAETSHAPVAQRIEHRTSDARVGGSSPSGRATCFPVSGRITTTHTKLPDTNFDTNPKVDAIKERPTSFRAEKPIKRLRCVALHVR